MRMPSSLARALKLSAWTALVLALGLGGYLVYLDQLITGTFEGRRWSVPAVIYAEPLELYPGAVLSLADVSAELNRLGYEQRTVQLAPRVVDLIARTQCV